jgi:hypothetical protein
MAEATQINSSWLEAVLGFCSRRGFAGGLAGDLPDDFPNDCPDDCL